MSLLTAPLERSLTLGQLEAMWRLKSPSVRENRVIPIIIVVAIIVLLILAASVVAAAIILCASHGGVFDTVANIKNGFVTIKCHKLR